MYENFKREVDQEVKRFRKKVTEIQTSPNPYFENTKIREYEVNKLRGELEKKVDEINAQFSAEIEPQIAEFEERAAKSFFKPTEADRKLVSEFVSDFLADAKLAYSEKDKLEAFDRFEQRIEYLDENGLHEVRKQLPMVFDRLGVDTTLTSKLRSLNATLRQLQTAEQMRLDELKDARINGVDAPYRRLRLTHPAYQDYANNRYFK